MTMSKKQKDYLYSKKNLEKLRNTEHPKGEAHPFFGRKHTIETRKKISKSHVNNSGKNHPFYGKKHSEETIKKMSETHKGKKLSLKHKKKISEAEKGIKNWNWRGGISFEPYGIEFNNSLKELIRERDKYRCQQCFRHQDELYDKNGKKYSLNVHHIDYDKQNNSPDNLISLCRNCHTQTNYTRNNWTAYFQEKLVGGVSCGDL